MTESMKQRLDLWEKALKGDAKSMVKLSLIVGLITPEQYEDYLQIEKEFGGENEQ